MPTLRENTLLHASNLEDILSEAKKTDSDFKRMQKDLPESPSAGAPLIRIQSAPPIVVQPSPPPAPTPVIAVPVVAQPLPPPIVAQPPPSPTVEENKQVLSTAANFNREFARFSTTIIKSAQIAAARADVISKIMPHPASEDAIALFVHLALAFRHTPMRDLVNPSALQNFQILFPESGEQPAKRHKSDK